MMVLDVFYTKGTPVERRMGFKKSKVGPMFEDLIHEKNKNCILGDKDPWSACDQYEKEDGYIMCIHWVLNRCLCKTTAEMKNV